MFDKIDDDTLEYLLRVLNAMNIKMFVEDIEIELLTRAMLRSHAAAEVIASFYEQHPTLCEGRVLFGIRGQTRGVT